MTELTLELERLAPRGVTLWTYVGPLVGTFRRLVSCDIAVYSLEHLTEMVVSLFTSDPSAPWHAIVATGNTGLLCAKHVTGKFSVVVTVSVLPLPKMTKLPRSPSSPDRETRECLDNLSRATFLRRCVRMTSLVPHLATVPTLY